MSVLARRPSGLVAAWSGIPLAGVALWAAPALTRACGLRTRLLPRLAGVGRPGHIALTFDDGPDPRGTPAILQALHTIGWRATFFMLGSQVRAHPDTARAVVRAGHEIAVHGDLHRNHLLRSYGDIHADLARAAATVQAVSGGPPRWFRPPYGVLTASTVLACRRLRLQPVLWTAWGRDWTTLTSTEVTTTVLTGLRSGGTVLLHDADHRPGTSTVRETTVETLYLMSAFTRRYGWNIGALDEHFAT